MAVQAQEELVLTTPEVKAERPQSPMDLLSLALQHGSGIDVIERLSALQERAMDRDAEMQFNQAMNAAQSEISRIAPDLFNPQTKSRYASYAKLDKILRPIYIKHGFSLSFNTSEPLKPESVVVLCYASHAAGHTRTYRLDMPADGKGAKGGDVMTKTHATGSALQYGMRYLLKSIFNIAIGADDDGNAAAGGSALSEEDLIGKLDAIENCGTMDELMKVFKAAYREAAEANDQDSMRAMIAAKDKAKKRLAEVA